MFGALAREPCEQMATMEEAAPPAPSIARQVKARLGAASLLLESLGNDAVRHKAASRAQRCALRGVDAHHCIQERRAVGAV